MAVCAFCGEQEFARLLEVWGHEFQIETCCETMHDIAAHGLADPDEARELLHAMDLEAHTGQALRRVLDDGPGLLLDWQLQVGAIAQGSAKQFVRTHHEHCPPPAGDRFRAAIWNGSTLLGVVMVGRPVARMLPQDCWVEVNRLCVRRDIPAPLRWNACSALYGWAAREARRRGMLRIITYTLETEDATTLRAAGWTCDGPVGRRGKSWNSPSRPRVDKTPTVPKVRWHRQLAKPREEARMAELRARLAAARRRPSRTCPVGLAASRPLAA